MNLNLRKKSELLDQYGNPIEPKTLSEAVQQLEEREKARQKEQVTDVAPGPMGTWPIYNQPPQGAMRFWDWLNNVFKAIPTKMSLNLRKKAFIADQDFFDFYGLSLIPYGEDQEVDKYRNMLLQKIKQEYINYLDPVVRNELKELYHTVEMYAHPEKYYEDVEPRIYDFVPEFDVNTLTLSQIRYWFEYANDHYIEAVDAEYGGELWIEILDSLIALKATDDPRQLTQLIDHINDLQHHSGSVFNKDVSFQADKFNNFLDIKANAAPQELLPFLSSDVRNMVYTYLILQNKPAIANPTRYEQFLNPEQHEGNKLNLRKKTVKLNLRKTFNG